MWALRIRRKWVSPNDLGFLSMQRMVANYAQVHVTFVHSVVLKLLIYAGKARPTGSVEPLSDGYTGGVRHDRATRSHSSRIDSS